MPASSGSSASSSSASMKVWVTHHASRYVSAPSAGITMTIHHSSMAGRRKSMATTATSPTARNDELIGSLTPQALSSRAPSSTPSAMTAISRGRPMTPQLPLPRSTSQPREETYVSATMTSPITRPVTTEAMGADSGGTASSLRSLRILAGFARRSGSGADSGPASGVGSGSSGGGGASASTGVSATVSATGLSAASPSF